VSLMVQDALLVAEVADDGRGFESAEGSPAGMGTRGMRERARALKGELKIESEPGKGTKVRFEMPLKRQLEEPEEIRVLLVEDHASFRQAAASAFEREGLEVVGQAGSLAEARKMLEQGAPDVAVIGLVLPDGYGWDLIKELRAANRRAPLLRERAGGSPRGDSGVHRLAVDGHRLLRHPAGGGQLPHASHPGTVAPHPPGPDPAGRDSGLGTLRHPGDGTGSTGSGGGEGPLRLL
jgi:hypothetical protein